MLTDPDKHQLKEWGVTPGMLELLNILVEKNMLSALVDIWNPELHIFQMRQFEMTITLEETQFLCQTRRNRPLLAFHHRPCYQAVIAGIVDAGLFESVKVFIDKSRDKPLLNIQALDKMMPNRAYYTGDTWLKCFLLRFVGELFFGPGKPRVEMAILAVVRAMI
jgi:hypothetical protein